MDVFEVVNSVIIILGVFGLVFVCLSIKKYHHIRSTIDGKTMGKVKSVYRKTYLFGAFDTKMYAVDVEYRYEGKTLMSASSALCKKDDQYQIGESVELIVDDNNHNKVVICDKISERYYLKMCLMSLVTSVVYIGHAFIIDFIMKL